MSDNDLIRRGDAHDALNATGYGESPAWLAIAALPAAPVFTAADLEAAFRVGRDMAVAAAEDVHFTHSMKGVQRMAREVIASCGSRARALTPPPDLAERVTEARDELAKAKGGGV